MIFTDGVHVVSSIDEEELHSFAAVIGLRREWFQDKFNRPHYDTITARKRQQAINWGAMKVSPKVIVAILEHRNKAKHLRWIRVFGDQRQHYWLAEYNVVTETHRSGSSFDLVTLCGKKRRIIRWELLPTDTSTLETIKGGTKPRNAVDNYDYCYECEAIQAMLERKLA